MKYLIIIVLILNILACSLKTKNIQSISQKHIYLESNRKLKIGNYKESIKLLKILQENYPFNPYEKQIQIDMVYAYYQLHEFKKAIKIIRNFISLNKNHPNIDYILYMYGLISQKLEEKNILEKIFKINKLNRDPKNYIIALKCFNKILLFHKHSLYIKDTKKKIKEIKEYLSNYEISIIKYYYKKKAYIAVINRAENLLKKYPHTKSASKAKNYIKKTMEKLNIKKYTKTFIKDFN